MSGKRRSGAEIARLHSTAGRRDGGNWPLLGAAGLLLAGAFLVGLAFMGPEAGAHPAPRDGLTVRSVVPAERYRGHRHIEMAYRRAAAIPAVLDGLYCYCRCSENIGHRSLLTCFESDHAAGCDVCMGEATLAFQLDRAGEPLNAVREAVDGAYSR